MKEIVCNELNPRQDLNYHAETCLSDIMGLTGSIDRLTKDQQKIILNSFNGKFSIMVVLSLF